MTQILSNRARHSENFFSDFKVFSDPQIKSGQNDFLKNHLDALLYPFSSLILRKIDFQPISSHFVTKYAFSRHGQPQKQGKFEPYRPNNSKLRSSDGDFIF